MGFDEGPPIIPVLLAARWTIVVTAVVAGLVGFALSSLQPATYTATAELLLSDPRNSGVFQDTGLTFLDLSRYVRNQAELAGSATVAERASQLIGGRWDADGVMEHVTVRPSVDLDLVAITGSDSSGAGAAQVANAVAEAYEDVVTDQVQANADASLAELANQRADLLVEIDEAERILAVAPDDASAQTDLNAATAQLALINGRADQIAVDASLFGSGVQLFQPAEIPDGPSAPQPRRNAALAFVLGAMAAAGLAWWRADETATADGRNDAARLLGAPLLGSVPDFAATGHDTSLPTVRAPKSPPAESFQFLVGAIAHALEDVNGRSIVITSASPGDGKTVTALNLAIAAAQDGREVLVVDADTRVRGMSRMLDLEEGAGLPELAAGTPLSQVVRLANLGDDRALPIVPAAPLGDDTAAFFRTPGFRKAVDVLAEPADLVVYDTPPLLLASDTSAIAGSVDGIVVVVMRGTPLRVLEELRERLDMIGTPLLGYVFTKARPRGGYGRYDYNYAYGYGEREAEAETELAKSS